MAPPPDLQARQGLAGSPSPCSMNAVTGSVPGSLRRRDAVQKGVGALPSQAPELREQQGAGSLIPGHQAPPTSSLQGCTAQWEALRHSVGAGCVSWDKTPLPPFSTFSTLRGPEGQACPLNRQLSATSCVSKCPGPQQHGPMSPRSYTPAVPVPSQKPLGVTLPWGRHLVSSPEMPWAGGFPGVGAHANLGQGGSPSPAAQGCWGLAQLVHLVSECWRQLREAAAGSSLTLGQGSLPA